MDFQRVQVPKISINPIPSSMTDWNLPFHIPDTPSPVPKHQSNPRFSLPKTKRHSSQEYGKHLICKYTEFQSINNFHQQWILDTQDRESLLGSGSAGTVYSVYKCYSKEFISNISDEYINGIKFCAKIIDIEYIKDPIIRIKVINNVIGEFQLVKNNNLLKYEQLYIDATHHHKAIIVMQQLMNPLNETHKCLGSELNDLSNDWNNGIIHFQDDDKFSRFAVDIATNIQKIHSLGYAHFDIKPENICFDPITNKWRIIDYGLYRKMSPNKVYKRRGLFGSKGFVAPEISIKRGHGTSVLTQAADVYAFGLILLFVINGGALYQHHKVWGNGRKLGIKECASVSFMHSRKGHCELYQFLKYLLLFRVINSDLYKVLRNALEYDYKKRMSMKEILKMAYFKQVGTLTNGGDGEE